MTDNIFGIKLKEARKIRGLSQDDLQAKCKLDTSAISALENGRRKPSMETLIKICDALNVSSDYMCGFTDSLNGKMNDELCDIINLLNAEDKELVMYLVECMINKANKRKK